MAKEFCRFRFYPSKPISHLPHEYRFADGSKSLVVDYATTDQLCQCRKMIDEAALRGDNVGVDEYEEDSETLKTIFNLSEIFHATDPVSGSRKAFMCIEPCSYQRMYDTCTASLYVFRTKDVDDDVYAELIDLMADFAKAMDTGYLQCFTQLALCHHGIYLQLRRRGFLTVATLPNWVNIAGNNLRDNAIMFKDLGLPERPVRSSEEVLRVLNSVYLPRLMLDKYWSGEFLQIPDLPKTFILENGMTLVLRNARKDEDHRLYEMFADAEKKGGGYAVHEFPSLDIMRLNVFADEYTAVLEEEKTNKIVGVLIFQDSTMSRSGKGKVGDELIVISAEFRGKDLGHFLYSMTLFLDKVLGYERILKDSAITTSSIFKMFRRHSQVSYCGALPRGFFQKDVGWVDLILAVQEVEELPDWHLMETKKSRL